VLISAALCAGGGVLAALTIRNDVLQGPAEKPAVVPAPEVINFAKDDADLAACRCQAALSTPTLPRRPRAS
jgi:hypothetical protein